MAPRARRAGEIDALKGRVAEALVEAILRRAGHRIFPAGREPHAPGPVRVGPDEFRPDFLVDRRRGESQAGAPPFRLLPVDVSYHASIEAFLGRHGDELLVRVRERWPALCLVLVTDQPAPGRACLQALDVGAARPGAPLAAVDLHEVPELDIYPTTVREYEGLVRQVFPLLRLGPAGARQPR